KMNKDILNEAIIATSLMPNTKQMLVELYKKGYKVWDIGHMFKDYDYWCKKKARTEAEIMQFYMPD
ncbi:MAG: DUF1792 domain-containing protein, partial [Lachnospiraceae bacterium]|nr:DUF1792 domain-containing protein [Lachnospiraceae bacterium]